MSKIVILSANCFFTIKSKLYEFNIISFKFKIISLKEHVKKKPQIYVKELKKI